MGYLRVIHILLPRYHPKIIEHILKKKQNNKCVCILEILGSIKMKIKMKKKNRSHRYDISRPRFSHGHKFSTHKT